MKRVAERVLVIAGLLVFMACRAVGTGGDDDPAGSEDFVTTDSSGQTFITDYTGKVWNITHAVEEYGFDPQEFEFGLGPYAIRPLLNPQYIERGHPDFPDDNDDMLVLGVDLEGQVCAYRLVDLQGYEIVGEKFGDQHVAVAY